MEGEGEGEEQEQEKEQEQRQYANFGGEEFLENHKVGQEEESGEMYLMRTTNSWEVISEGGHIQRKDRSLRRHGADYPPSKRAKISE